MPLIPQRIDEADVRRVEVEQADRRARGTEAVLDVRRNRHVRARAGTAPFASAEELDLAVEDVERIRVIGVGVQVDALEVRGERELDRLDVADLAEDTVLSDPFPLAGREKNGLVHRRSSCRTT